MAQKRAAWGIDIGQSSFKAIKLEYSEAAEQVIATAFDYIQYPKILSQPDAIPDEIIGDAMKTFLSRNPVGDDLIAIGVPGHSSLARFIQLPPVESSRLPEIVKYEARQQIPFALEDVIWDFQPLGSGSEESGYLLDAEVGLFAMKKEGVHAAMRPFINSKLEVELIQTAPLALYNVLSFDELGIKRGETVEPRDEYNIVLDMGCDNTTLMISNGPKIWIRNIPVGGNHFTRALTKEMKLSFSKAEHLKCNATRSADPRAVFQALRPVFNDYVSEIQRSIGFFSSVNRQAKVSKVLGLGNGFKLAGLQKFLQQNLQYEVVKPDSYKALAGDSVVNAPQFNDNILSFAVPYGLALQALGVTRIRTTLLPPEIATARMVRRKKPWAALTAAGALAACSIGMIGDATAYVRVHNAPFDDAISKAEAFTSKVGSATSAYQAEEATFSGAKTELENLVNGRRSMDWMEIFNTISDCLPIEENPGETPINLRKVVSVDYLTFKKEPDVSTWFTKLSTDLTAKSWMDPKDFENPPSGGGYIATLYGHHWHHVEDDPSQNDVNFLVSHFLRNLQKPILERSGMARDVGRMGISHATVVNFATNEEYIPKAGIKQPRTVPRVNLGSGAPQGVGGLNSGAMDGMDAGNPALDLGTPGGFGADIASGLGAGGGYDPAAGGMEAGGMGTTPVPADLENYNVLHKTTWKIEFVYKPIPKADRGKEAEGEGAEGTSAEGGDSTME